MLQRPSSSLCDCGFEHRVEFFLWDHEQLFVPFQTAGDISRPGEQSAKFIEQFFVMTFWERGGYGIVGLPRFLVEQKLFPREKDNPAPDRNELFRHRRMAEFFDRTQRRGIDSFQGI